MTDRTGPAQSAEVTWFRPVWPMANNVAPEPWHVYRPGLDDEEHAVCGAAWPKRLAHGYFDARSEPTTARVCESCARTVGIDVGALA